LIKGTKAQWKKFVIHGSRPIFVLPAVSLQEGVLCESIVEGSFSTKTFKTFIERLLKNMQPYPAPNSVVVMEDCTLHRHQDIIDLIHSRGMRVEFLPSQSPDLNPIELVLLSMKNHLRQNGDYARLVTTSMTGEEIYITLGCGLYRTCQDIQVVKSWFAQCGYI